MAYLINITNHYIYSTLYIRLQLNESFLRTGTTWPKLEIRNIYIYILSRTRQLRNTMCLLRIKLQSLVRINIINCRTRKVWGKNFNITK